MNLRKCAGRVKSLAKALWTLSYAVRIVGAVLAVALVYKGIHQNEAQATILLLIFSVAAIVTNYSYSMVRGVAEQLKRMSELNTGLGLPKDEQFIQDSLNMPIIRNFAGTIRKDSFEQNVDPNKEGYVDPTKVDYYVTREPVGASRLAEMIHESAWFSGNHARSVFAGLIYVLIAIVFILLCTLYLLGSGNVQFGNTLAENNQQISRFAAVIATFLISVGIIESAIQYQQFAKTSDSIVSKLSRVIAEGNPSAIVVASIVSEYQIARHSSPVLPDWLHFRDGENLGTAYSKIYSSLKTPANSPYNVQNTESVLQLNGD